MLQTLSALGATPWIVPSRNLTTGFGVFLTFSTDANMTVTVQHTGDVPMTPRSVSISRSGTVATITDAAHSLLTGDNVIIINDATFAGSWDLASVVDANTYTITVPNSGATSSTIALLQSFRVFPNDNAALVNVSGTPPARADGNYAFAIAACRLKASAYTAGVATLTVLQAFGGGQ